MQNENNNESMPMKAISDPTPNRPLPQDPNVGAPVQLEFSFGERAARIDQKIHIASNHPNAATMSEREFDILYMKKNVAAIIDLLNKYRAQTKGEAVRYFAKAISSLEDGLLNAETGILWPYNS